MSFPRYESYKDSGVEWLGEVPEHWIIAKTSRFFKIAMGQTILKEDLVDDGLWPVFSATDGDHYFGLINNPQVRLGVGDLVIPARGNSIGAVKIVKEPATTTQTTIYCKNLASEQLIAEYVYYFMRGFRNSLFYFTQTAIPQITVDEVGSNPISLPPVSEQLSIAQFLDQETAKIDNLIAEQQRLIALLKEKRQTVISHAVTKGLNPNVPMKDSGVEWLGEVPEHWDILKGSYIGSLFGSEQVIESLITDEGDIPFIKVASLSLNDFNITSWDWFINQKESTQFNLRSNFIVFPKRGAAIFTNKVNIVERPSLIDPNLMGWELCDRVINKFIAFVLKSRRIDELADVSTVPQINNKHINPEKFPIPPIQEQKIIVSFLDRETAKIDNLIAESTNVISLLKERRSALISSAVTGKIDVRNFVPSQPKVEAMA